MRPRDPAAERQRAHPAELRETVLLIIGCAVTFAWVVAVIVEVIFPTHAVPAEVHGIMALLIPALFGSAAYQGRKARNGQ